MSDALAQEFWAWSLDRYARPGVEEALIALQDRRGLDVCLLLWCAWRGARGDLIDPQRMMQAVTRLEQWSKDVTGRLRAVRRALKASAPEAVDAGALALREAVKKLELEAEKIAHAMLARLAYDDKRQADREDAATRARRNFGVYLATACPAGETFDSDAESLLDALCARLFACSGPREGSKL